ncbi:PD-(D/E)XK nuclease-like domain-containing protein [Vibrio vulnificus]|uniref:PD-(D/E)XK nuclease-like domain-containing protein n=2 Tax=Vibrio vulnificus TaxID=672 RepID=UPI002FBE9B7B
MASVKYRECNIMISRKDFSEVSKAMPHNVILQTTTGVIANLNDNDYFAIKSHSKHSLEPALRSGIDYEFFTVENRGQKKASDGMDDGRLLHCMALEPNSFNNRYKVAEDYDRIYKDHHHYFANVDAFKAFITEHNKKYSEFTKELKDAVKAYNRAAKTSTQQTVSAYEELPEEFQVATLSKPSEQKALQRFEQIALSTFSDDLTEEQLNSDLNNRLSLLANYLSTTFNDEELRKLHNATNKAKKEILTQCISALQSKWPSLNQEQRLNIVPRQITDSLLTQAAKNKAISNYNKIIKSTDSAILDEKESPKEIMDVLQENDALPESLRNTPAVYQFKLVNVGGKKGDKEQYTLKDIVPMYEAIYKQKPIIRTDLIECEKEKVSIEGKELITIEQYQHAKRIIDTLYSHPLANKWLTLEGNMPEVAIFWNEYISHPSLEWLEEQYQEDAEQVAESTGSPLPSGVRKVFCKGKLDLLNLMYNVAIDLKFVTSVEMDKLCRDAGAFNYHIQDAFYTRGFNKVLEGSKDGAETLQKFVFIFVEKDAPTLGKEETKPIRVRVGCYTPQDKQRANELIDATFLEIEHWYSTGHFDGFECEETLTVPVYQVRREMDYLAAHRTRMDHKVKHEQSAATPKPTVHNDSSPSDNRVATNHQSKVYPDFDDLLANSTKPTTNAA